MDSRCVCPRDVGRRIAHGDSPVPRPVACASPCEIDQLCPLLRFAAERTLPAREELLETDLLHPSSRHRLGVAREEGTVLDLRERCRAARARATITCAV